MRALLPLALCVVLAGVSASGCSKKEEAHDRSSSTIGSSAGEGSPKGAAPRPGDPGESAKRTAPAPVPPSTDRAGGEKRWDKPASREAKGAEAMVAAGRPGAGKPPAPAQMDLPEG
jgi:hypothetical protein